MRNLSFFLMLALIVSAGVSCSSTPKKRSVGEVIDDSVITSKLKIKYLRDKVVKGFRIDIDAWKGVVSLRGKVDSPEQISRATDIAERQPGVREVKSYLIIRASGKDRKSIEAKKGSVEEKDLGEGPSGEVEVAGDIPDGGEPESPEAETKPKGDIFEDESEMDRPPSEVTGGGY